MKTNANIFSTTCQEMSDSRKYWWLSISSRKRLPCFVELLRIPETERDPVSMSIPETRVAERHENKVGFYVELGGDYVNIFIGVLPGPGPGLI